MTVTAGAVTGTLAFAGTPLVDAFSVTADTLSAGTGATVTYPGLAGPTVAGGTGADTYLANGGSGADVYNLTAAAAAARRTVASGTGPSTVNVGSNAPTRTGDTLAPPWPAASPSTGTAPARSTCSTEPTPSPVPRPWATPR